MKDLVELICMLVGVLCFIFIAVDSLMHFGFAPQMHHSDKPMHFLSSEIYWILNLSLATIGGALVSLKHPIIGAITGLITGILLQLAFTVYLFWRLELMLMEIIFPAIIPLIVGFKIYKSLTTDKKNIKANKISFIERIKGMDLKITLFMLFLILLIISFVVLSNPKDFPL